MSDNKETGEISGASGDPGAEAIRVKEEVASESTKTESPKITAISGDVVSAEQTPSDDKNVASGPAAGEGGDATVAVNIADTKPEASALANGSEALLTSLQEEVQKRTKERDNFEKKLGETEKKLAALQAAYEAATSGKGDEMSLRKELEELKMSLTQSHTKFNERGRLLANQENQINALTKQVSSLKEVVAITKNLLEIRNMEVKHLQADVDSMENRITAERDRHNAMLQKMNAAVRLNADLKTEYETQLRLFQDLRGKYEEKVTLLTSEKESRGAEQPVVEPAIQ